MRRGSALLLVIAATAVAGAAHGKGPKVPRSNVKGAAKVKPLAAVAPPPPPPPVLAPPPPPPPTVFAPPPAADPVERTPVDRAPPLPGRFAVTLNPLGFAVGRYGANGELLLTRHHALTASAFVQSFPAWMIRTVLPGDVDRAVDLADRPASRFGGELGYRFYPGSEGARGFWIGPSFVSMPLAYPRLTDDFRAEVVSFQSYGAALDLGVQAITSSGFTIGGGVGVMALAWSPPSSATPPPGAPDVRIYEPHVLPRLLFSAGWAF